jgi:hypothetical protein
VRPKDPIEGSFIWCSRPRWLSHQRPVEPIRMPPSSNAMRHPSLLGWV